MTYHHNWYDRTPQRNPRTRFGDPVHIYNNYFLDNSDTGPACNADSGCFVEGNYFEDVEEPMTNSYSGPEGSLVERNNVFVGDTGEPVTGGSVENPAADYYDYVVDDPQAVKDTVMRGAGPGTIGL
ncbi:Putative bifunctional pectate lyase/pectinesterase OS=Streptomyces glaucescens OX=1907 GN=SGLAU_15935 PE=3 SV=1 [Streptomyces glaucescens]